MTLSVLNSVLFLAKDEIRNGGAFCSSSFASFSSRCFCFKETLVLSTPHSSQHMIDFFPSSGIKLPACALLSFPSHKVDNGTEPIVSPNSMLPIMSISIVLPLLPKRPTRSMIILEGVLKAIHTIQNNM